MNAASLALKVYQTQQQMERLDRQEQAQQAARAQQQAAADGGAAASTQPDMGGAAAAAEGSGEPSSRQEPATGASGSGGTDSSSGSSSGGIPAQEQKSVPAPQQPSGPASGAAAPDSAAAATAAAAAAAERAKLEEQALPIMLDAMWAANVLDIQSTLRHVCRRVLNDPQVWRLGGWGSGVCAGCGGQGGSVIRWEVGRRRAEKDSAACTAEGPGFQAGCGIGGCRQQQPCSCFSASPPAPGSAHTLFDASCIIAPAALPQVPKPVRQQRAEGLRELGRIFRAARAPGTQPDAGASAGGGKAGAAAQQAGQQAQRSAKQQMEDAMLRVLEKRMQQADSAA